MALVLSSKRVQINKANMNMIVVLSIAAFVTVFSLVASRALLGQRSYQAKVIAQKEKAKNQLKENLKAAGDLSASYNEFVSKNPNVLGGIVTGTSDRDGTNAKIMLDALPSKYNFPALTTSLEKILTSQNYKIQSITGTDDELTQVANAQSDNPQPIEIPFEIAATGTYAAIQELVGSFDRSIRPFHINTIIITTTGTDAEVTATIGAKSYYQPEKSLNIRSEVVK